MEWKKLGKYVAKNLLDIVILVFLIYIAVGNAVRIIYNVNDVEFKIQQGEYQYVEKTVCYKKFYMPNRVYYVKVSSGESDFCQVESRLYGLDGTEIFIEGK